MNRSFVAVAVAVVLVGCGDDDTASGNAASASTQTRTADTAVHATSAQATATVAKGTTIALRGSPFGKILFDSGRQAIYIFENDRRNKTVCYGECAEAWPPVYTSGKPRATRGVRAALLGTIKRRDGRRQVTYAGKPLYYYAHEGPGEVRCHNVNLNGGLWWVVGSNGKRRP